MKIVRRSQIQDSPTHCPRCGSASIRERRSADTVDFRGLELDIEGLSKQACESCAYLWETPEQLADNKVLIRQEYTRVRDETRARFGLLTGERISEVREELKLTQKEAALLFGGGANAFNKYESGEVLQSFAMDRLIRLTAAVGQLAVAFLRNVDSSPQRQRIASAPIRSILIDASVPSRSALWSKPASWSKELSMKPPIQLETEWNKQAPSEIPIHLMVNNRPFIFRSEISNSRQPTGFSINPTK